MSRGLYLLENFLDKMVDLWAGGRLEPAVETRTRAVKCYLKYVCLENKFLDSRGQIRDL